MRIQPSVLFSVVFALIAPVSQAATNNPVTVSPGNTSGISQIAERCPTFSWGTVAGARSYELVVYALPDEAAVPRGEADRVVQVNLPGVAGAWTPSLAQCLAQGKTYAWSVRAHWKRATSDWSDLALFRVAEGPTGEELREALMVVQRYLANQSEEAASARGGARLGSGSETEAAVQAEESSPPPEGGVGAAFSVDGTGNVQGASFTGAGSGLTGVDAATVDGLEAASSATANTLLALDGSAKLPASITGDADTLDGNHATDFAPAAGSANYVAKAGDTMTGTLNLPSNGLAVGTNQLVVSGGNVGVATNSPQHPLHLSKSLNGEHLVAMVENTGPFSAAALRLKTPASGNTWTMAAQETGSASARGFEIQHTLGILFAISATTGNVGIGKFDAADKLDVAGDVRVGTGTTGCVKDADGTTIAGTCSSDARLKKNITPLSNMLPRVAQLNPVHFNWRSEEYPDLALGDETQLGLIAQDVERVMPELVSDGDDGLKRVHYSELPILLLQAVKEQQQENERLRQRVSELSERLRALEH